MEKSKPPPPSPSLLRRLISLDTTISLRVHNLTQPILPFPLLKTLEISGDGRLFFPILLSLLLSPLSLSSLLLARFLVNLLIGSLFDLILIGLIKHLIKRPRPIYNKHMFLTFSVNHWSFPSGHSSRVCFIATFVFLSSDLIPSIVNQLRDLEFEFVNKLMIGGLIEGVGLNYVIMFVVVWAISTSVSRVLLGRHFVFDVVAGALLGVGEGLLVFHFLNCIQLTLLMKFLAVLLMMMVVLVQFCGTLFIIIMKAGPLDEYF